MDANQRGVVEGLTVYSSDGSKVGKVIRCGSTAFEVEKGFFFPRDYLLSYADVRQADNDRVTLALTKDQLKEKWERADLLGDRAHGVSANAPIGYTTAEEVRRSTLQAQREERLQEQEAIHSSAPSDTYRDVVPAQSKFQHEHRTEGEDAPRPISHRDFREREAGIYAGGEPTESLNTGTITELDDSPDLDVDEVRVAEDLSKPRVNKDDDYKFE